MKKLKKVEAELIFLTSLHSKRNAGVAFVSFRDKNCVI
jgi:hypothetical protein